MRKGIFVVLLSICCAWLVSTGSAQQSSNQALIVGISADPITLDPHDSTAQNDRNYYYQLFDTLVRLTTDLDLAPGLAESWENPNPTTYVLHLQPNVTFHDGTPFNAEAVKWNFDRMLDPDEALPRQSEISMIDKVEVVDGDTVRILLSQPYAPFLSVLTDRAGMMVSPDAVTKYGDDFGLNPVGTGPFVFNEWSRNNRVVLEKNQDYWEEGLPKIEGVEYRIFPDPTVKLTNVRTGNAHIVDDVPPQSVASIQQDTQVDVYEIDGLGYRYLDLNTVKQPFDDVLLRQAVSGAIDRGSLVENVLRGTAVVAEGPCPPSLWCHDPDFHPYERDLEVVTGLLEEADIPSGFSFTLIVANDSTDQVIAQFIQAQLAEVNIRMDIQTVDASALSDALTSGEYEAMLVGWSGRGDPDGNLYGEFYTDAPINYRKWSNPQVDQLLDDARATLDQNERYDLYLEVQSLIAEGAPIVFLYSPKWIHVASNQLEGYQMYPDGRFRFKDVTLSSSY